MNRELTYYKLNVLYLLEHAGVQVSNSQISEFVLEAELTNYFDLQQALSELVETGFIRLRTSANTSYYQITPDGTSALSYFEKDLSEANKNRILSYLEDMGFQSKHRLLYPADFYQSDQGNYYIRCQITEDNNSLLEVSMAVPSREAARAICLNWPRKSQEIYQTLLDQLL